MRCIYFYVYLYSDNNKQTYTMKNLLNRIAALEEKQFTSELTAQEQETYFNLVELATKFLTSKN